jgi:hypothetical protein
LRRLDPTEADLQALVVDYCRVCATKDWRYALLVHTPNQGRRSLRYGAELKRLGMSKGFPDLTLHWANRGRLLYIEMKRKGGKASPEQLAWQALLTRAGHIAIITDSAEEAIRQIQAHLEGHSN